VIKKIYKVTTQTNDNKGFADALLHLEWLQISLIISGFPCLICHLNVKGMEHSTLKIIITIAI